MVSRLPQDSQTFKRTGASSFEKCLSIFTARASLLRDLLFVSEFTDFMISSKDISTSLRSKCSLDIFFMLGIFLRYLIVAAVEVCLV